MHHDWSPGQTARPPLRKFDVYINPVVNDVTGEVLRNSHITTVTAHLYFNNEARGEGYVFRRYYEDDVRTEKVATFAPGVVAAVVEQPQPDEHIPDLKPIDGTQNVE